MRLFQLETTINMVNIVEEKANTTEINYILNTNTKKFHYPRCSSVGKMSEKNKKELTFLERK